MLDLVQSLAIAVLGVFAATQGLLNWKMRRENDRLWDFINSVMKDRTTIRSTPKPFTRTRKD